MNINVAAPPTFIVYPLSVGIGPDIRGNSSGSGSSSITIGKVGMNMIGSGIGIGVYSIGGKSGKNIGTIIIGVRIGVPIYAIGPLGTQGIQGNPGITGGSTK